MNDIGVGGAVAPVHAARLLFKGRQWDDLVNNLPIGIYACETSGHIVQYNHQAAVLWGHAPTIGAPEFRFCGAYKAFALSGEPLPASQSPMAEVLRTGRPIRGREFIIERPDASRVHVQANIEPLFDERGAIVGGVSCFQEITEREAASPEGIEHRSRELLNALPAAIYTTDREGRISFYNDAAVKLAGRVPEPEDRWCVSWRLYRPDGTQLPHEECPMAVTLKEQRAVRGTELLAERPDGTRVPILPYPTPLHDDAGNFVGAVNLLIDISQLKSTQDSLVRRMNEQMALYQFTDRLYRSESLDNVYEAALDAILSALRCDRASILSFDETGVMRFVAWRGLSAGYRAAVEGHSPWKQGDTDPRPIFFHDIDAADIPDSLKATVKSEGIRALAFIPLVANGGVIGKFMTYYEGPHAFSDEEVGLAVTIARQLGFAIERKRAADERKRGESQRDLLVAELSHRVKNTLATVISIAHQSFAKGQSVEESRGSFAARIQALAQTHSRLAEAKWSGVSFKTILLDEFAPYIREDGGNVRLAGPDIMLNSKSAVTLGMAFHELVTNAVKYGALSTPEGVVDVDWKLVDAGRQLQFRWQEANGPKVLPPKRSGFGRLLLERVLAADLRGDVRMEFAEQGLGCTVSFPLHDETSLERNLA